MVRRDRQIQVKTRVDKAVKRDGEVRFRPGCIVCGKSCLRRGASAIHHVVGEIPAGEMDGANKIFTLAHIPIMNTLEVSVNGRRLDVFGKVEGAILTLGGAPAPGTEILVDYLFVDG